MITRWLILSYGEHASYHSFYSKQHPVVMSTVREIIMEIEIEVERKQIYIENANYVLISAQII